MFFHDKSGNFVSIPLEWTNMVNIDPFIKISKGRCCFRFQDLLSLSELLKDIKAQKSKVKKLSEKSKKDRSSRRRSS